MLFTYFGILFLIPSQQEKHPQPRNLYNIRFLSHRSDWSQWGSIQDPFLLKEQVSICLLLMPLNHSYTHFYQLLWKRVSQLSSPHIWHQHSLSLALSLSGVWLDAAVQPLWSDYLHRRGCQNKAHNFSWWSQWLPSVAEAVALKHLRKLPSIRETKNYKFSLCSESFSWMMWSLECKLTIHAQLSWCFALYCGP